MNDQQTTHQPAPAVLVALTAIVVGVSVVAYVSPPLYRWLGDWGAVLGALLTYAATHGVVRALSSP